MIVYRVPLSLALALLTLSPALATASERRFTYTYESVVLNKGELEFEPWTTIRAGRDGYYLRFDERLEFEVGLTDRLQTALYLNFSAVMQDDVLDARKRSFNFGGVSSEWKYKLLDPVAHPLGLALYFETTLAPHELELEGKLILDKRLGRFLVAFNTIVEYEWNFESKKETEKELVLEFTLGLGFYITHALFAGLEVRNHNEFVAGHGFEHSSLFAGPTVSYAGKRWWVATTVLPQLPALKKDATHGSGLLDLQGHERIEARLIFGWHL
ncbi:MAG: hypothetical protein IT371_22315 [Deltaproteobacteria bacterium]|nr:hypothetical protein [Deltaproteobacteria bacterium]